MEFTRIEQGEETKEDGESKTIREWSGDDKVDLPTCLSRLLSKRTRGVLWMRRTKTFVSPGGSRAFSFVDLLAHKKKRRGLKWPTALTNYYRSTCHIHPKFTPNPIQHSIT
jgi:hypothetical protein